MMVMDAQQRPKIAWVVKGLGLGGAERIVADLAPELARSGMEIVVLSTLRLDTLADEITESGVAVTCPPRFVPWPFWLVLKLLSGRFDATHTHSPLPAAVLSVLGPVMSLSARWPTRNIDTAHTDPASYHRVTRWLTGMTSAMKDGVIATSEISRIGAPAEIVVHHGIPTVPRLSAAERRLNSRKLVSVAGLRDQKDHATLLHAFKIVADASSDSVTLDLIGDGPLRPELEALADELDVGHLVSFLGWRRDVRTVLPNYGVFVLSTHFEGFPIALVEALRCGLVPVATDVPGNREALTCIDGATCGFLTDERNPEALAVGIQRGMAEAAADSVMGSLAIRSDELSIGVTRDAYLHLYEDQGLLTAR